MRGANVRVMNLSKAVVEGREGDLLCVMKQIRDKILMPQEGW